MTGATTDAIARVRLHGRIAHRTRRAPESSLYPVVKAFLAAQGFDVKGEVCGCDIVAVLGSAFHCRRA